MTYTNINDRKREKRKNRLSARRQRIDFTPLVDMNMLLITFFMLCKILSVPQKLDISMPDNFDYNLPESASYCDDYPVITVILDKDNKVFYYNGMPRYDDYTSLKETDNRGLRELLLRNNKERVMKIAELKDERYKKRIAEAEFQEILAELKYGRCPITVTIKPTANSYYKNLIDALDEMEICGVGKYAVVDMTPGDWYLMENYATKGIFGSELRQ